MDNLSVICNPCLMCGLKPAKSISWQYIWNGKSGFACESCSIRWYNIGTYLNETAASFFETDVGVYVSEVKDKFGYFRIYMGQVNPKQIKQINELHKEYKLLFKEFTFDWDYVDEK